MSKITSTEGYEFELTGHARKQAVKKGFNIETIAKTFRSPKKVYPSGSHPGQYRVTGNGICLVGQPDPIGEKFTIITMYADEVLTPPRPDQLKTPEGKRYALRYQKGLGRG